MSFIATIHHRGIGSLGFVIMGGRVVTDEKRDGYVGGVIMRRYAR